MIPNYCIKYVKRVFVIEFRGFFLVCVSVNFDRRAQPDDDDDVYIDLTQGFNKYKNHLLLLLLIVFPLGFSYFYTYFDNKPDYRMLAIMQYFSEDIDIGFEHHWHFLRNMKITVIESVEITQKATDESKDESKGLHMNIASISRKNWNYFENTYTGTSFTVVSKSTQYFIIPDGYINEPVYLWKMSRIRRKT